MKNLSLKERMRENGSGGWGYPAKYNLVRVDRPYKESWKKSIHFYLKVKYDDTDRRDSLEKFFSAFIPREEIGEISYEGHIAILVDEAIYRRNPQLEFDFNPSEKVSV